jgi:hypothetical protein
MAAEAGPDSGSATPVLGADAPELDPRRVEFVGYAEPRPALASPPIDAPDAPAAMDPTVGQPVAQPPTGSILDLGRRPPGARPIDPDAPKRVLPPPPVQGAAAVGATAGLAAQGAAPGSADVWNLVTVPPAPAPAARGSRAGTALLSMLVALVILALVAGFLYMFAGIPAA